MAIRALDLFDAFAENKLPKDKAYLISSFVNANTGYTIYEIISYSAVKAIYPDGGGLTFQSSGKKLHVLVEPASYPHKGTEPYLREKNEQIPLRFSEVEIITSRNQIKIMIAKKPNDSLSAFTVAKPTGFNVSFVFYFLDDIYETLAKFFEQTLNRDAHIPRADAKKTAQRISDTIKHTLAFKSDYS